MTEAEAMSRFLAAEEAGKDIIWETAPCYLDAELDQLRRNYPEFDTSGANSTSSAAGTMLTKPSTRTGR